MANEGGGYALSGESREDDDQMDVWSDFEEGKSSEEIRNRLGIVSVSDLVRQGRLRWFGHVERKDADDWVSACRNMAVSGERGKGRKTWKECVAVEVEAGRCTGSRCLEEWHFGEPSNPCKRGNADVKPMMMMISSPKPLQLWQ